MTRLEECNLFTLAFAFQAGVPEHSNTHTLTHLCDSHFHIYRFGWLIIDENRDMTLSSFFPDQLAAGAPPVRVVTLMT